MTKKIFPKRSKLGRKRIFATAALTTMRAMLYVSAAIQFKRKYMIISQPKPKHNLGSPFVGLAVVGENREGEIDLPTT